MTNERKSNSENLILMQIVWRYIIAIGESMERFTTWTITGVAAAITFLLANLESVSSIVSAPGLKWCLILLSFSLIAGVVSKNIGMSVTHGANTVRELNLFFSSEKGKDLIQHVTINSQELMKDIADPFIWPLSWVVKRNIERGFQDYSSSDRNFVRLFCLQLYSDIIHALLAAGGVITLALSIRSI